MPDYAKTIIYKIVCKDVNIKETYGGHTTNIIKRRQRHKSNCNNENADSYNCYVYKFIRENGGWENWDLLWCYDYSCGSKREASFEERRFIELNHCELNSCRPIVSKEEAKEYYKKNKEKIQNQSKDYYENNKEKIKERTNEKFKCECGGRYTKVNKVPHFKTKKHQKYLQHKII
jgi:hypothetical protein